MPDQATQDKTFTTTHTTVSDPKSLSSQEATQNLFKSHTYFISFFLLLLVMIALFLRFLVDTITILLFLLQLAVPFISRSWPNQPSRGRERVYSVIMFCDFCNAININNHIL